jgi:hypothetical protein
MSEHKHLSWLLPVGGFIVFVATVLAICIPNYISNGRSKTNVILNNLRQLEGAKEQWAFEHGKTGAVAVTEQDLAPYLRELRPVAGEKYILKRLSECPEAQLTHSLEGKPKGTVLRFSTNGTLDVIWPQK